MATDAYDLIFKPTELSLGSNSTGDITLGQQQIRITIRTGTMSVKSINIESEALANYLATGYDPATPYTPEYPGSPATKKYVDQHDTIVSATAPSNPTEGMVWYDTTENSLKAYNGTSWETEGTKMVIMSYGNSTWQDFIDAYNENAVVYCRASSNSNPATGAQNRLAFMAYVNNASSPTEVEFQYYRSRSSHGSDANQQDEVYVYKLTNASGGTWTVEVRDTAARIATGTGLTNSYTTSSGITTMTIANDGVLTVNGSKGTVTVNDIKQSATEPSDKTAGTTWYDTTNGALKVYNGSSWDTIATGGAISDTAYGSGWNGQTTTAPSQNAVYDKIESVEGEISTNTSAISTINGKIPSEATTSNQLADKQYVLNNINSVTAYYITKNAQGDQFATYAELAAATTFYSGGQVRVPTMNDYTIVLADENHDNATTRYIYNSGWEYQYTINETPLTQAQLNALNSGITSGKVSTYDGYATGKQDTLVSGTNIKTINSQSLLGNGDIAINGILSGPLVPAASATYAGRIWFDTTNNKFWKCDGTAWTEVTPVLSVNGGTGAITVNDVKVSSTAPSNPSAGTVWYDTANNLLKSYNGSSWTSVGAVLSVNGQTGAVLVNDVKVASTAPANPSAGTIWYDTTNNLLKAYDGSNWNNVGEGDMAYSDFSWKAKSGTTITLDLACTITPTANFTVNAPATIKDGQSYILRVNNQSTAYTMTLGTGITNPYGTDLTLTAGGVDQFLFLAIGGNLELQPEAGGAVTSVNGETGDVTVEPGITKVFTLSSTSDLTNAQAAYDRLAGGKSPILKYSSYGDSFYVPAYIASSAAYFTRVTGYGSVSSGAWEGVATIKLALSSGTVTAISYNINNINISSAAPSSGTTNSNITLVI